MTRRIALSVMALVTAVIVLAVIPLGLSMTDRERVSFRDDTSASARSIASTAEETLSDHRSAAPARALVAASSRRGACAMVFDRSGRLVMSGGCPDAVTGTARRLAPVVLADRGEHLVENGTTLTSAVPVGDVSDTSGVAVLSRPLGPLHDRIAVMWGWFALTALVTLGAALATAARLARWVGRPLHALDAVARRLGEGALEARAPDVGGPPEVRRLAATFNTMAGRTEALVHGHRAVVADVSHQLRTPLTALRLRLDLLAADADDGTAGELAGAQLEIARLSRLVDGLLAVARAEHTVPRPVSVAVHDVLADRVAAWEPVARERDVSLLLDCRPGLRASLGGGDLEQVLDNLIANAVDAIGAGHRVSITATRRHDTVRVRVADNGPGMSPQAREAAFHRFGNPRATGSGLGLAIVHRLVTANGGTAALADTPGGGLTVVLVLPAAG